MQSAHSIILIVLAALIVTGALTYTVFFRQLSANDVAVKTMEVDWERAYSGYRSIDSQATVELRMSGGTGSALDEALAFLSPYVKTEDAPETVTVTLEMQDVSPFSPAMLTNPFGASRSGSGLLSVSSNLVEGDLRMEMRSVNDTLFVRFFDFFTFTDKGLQDIADAYINRWLSVDEESLAGLGGGLLPTSPLDGVTPGDDFTFTDSEIHEIQRIVTNLTRILIDREVFVLSFTEKSTEDRYHIAYRMDPARFAEVLNDEQFRKKVVDPFITLIYDAVARSVDMPDGRDITELRQRVDDAFPEVRDTAVRFIDEHGERVTLSGEMTVDRKTFASPTGSVDAQVALPSEDGRTTEIGMRYMMTLGEQEVTLEAPEAEGDIAEFTNALFLHFVSASLGSALLPQ